MAENTNTNPEVKPETKPVVKAPTQKTDNKPIVNEPTAADNHVSVTLERMEKEKVNIEEDDGERLFNINMLFDARGFTKNPRLDEIQSNAYQERQGDDPSAGVNTAREVAEAIIGRAGIIDGPQRDDLVKIFTKALKTYVKDPVRWQNPHGNFYNVKRESKKSD